MSPLAVALFVTHALVAQDAPLVLTDDDAVALATENSPVLSRLEERVREEEAWRDGALRFDNPELRMRHHKPEHVLAPLWGQPVDPYPLDGTRVDLRWSPPALDAFGARQTEGDRRIDRRQALLADGRAKLEENVRALHARVLHLQRRVTLADDAVALSARTEKLVQRLRDEALATVLDVSLARLDAFDAIADRETSRHELADELVRLRTLLGLSPSAVVELVAPQESLCRLPQESALELVELAVARSWQLRALEAERLAEVAERDAYVLERIPWVDYVQASVIPGDRNDPSTIGVSVGIELPVLDWRLDDERRADARVGALVADARVRERSIGGRVRRAHERLVAEVALVDLYRGAQAAVIDESLTQVDRALEVGQLDASSVALVQRRALAKKREALTATWRCQRSALALRRLTTPSGSEDGSDGG